MEQKQLSQLDPQLQAMYQRVMDTTSQQAPDATSSTPNVTPAPQTTTVSKRSFSPISPVMVGITLLLFFFVYTLFWIRVFNVDLPFALPF